MITQGFASRLDSMHCFDFDFRSFKRWQRLYLPLQPKKLERTYTGHSLLRYPPFFFESLLHSISV
jgi:hypothetical protein